GLWEQARRVLAGPAPKSVTFIHGDYQHFNLLWTRGRLTGVIDWTLGGMGHPDRTSVIAASTSRFSTHRPGRRTLVSDIRSSRDATSSVGGTFTNFLSTVTSGES